MDRRIDGLTDRRIDGSTDRIRGIDGMDRLGLRDGGMEGSRDGGSQHRGSRIEDRGIGGIDVIEGSKDRRIDGSTGSSESTDRRDGGIEGSRDRGIDGSMGMEGVLAGIEGSRDRGIEGSTDRVVRGIERSNRGVEESSCREFEVSRGRGMEGSTARGIKGSRGQVVEGSSHRGID